MRPSLPLVVRALLLPALAATLALPARAQDVLEATSGRTYEGKVLSNDGSTVEIETTQGARLKLPYEQLTAASQYRLRRAITGTDGAAQLELAEWCVGKALYPEARRHYRLALEADATLADAVNASMATARTTAANELLARAKALQASNMPQDARALLATIVQELPLEAAAQEATQLLAADTETRKQEALSPEPKRGTDAKAPRGGAATDVPLRNDGQPFSEATRTAFAPVLASFHKLLDGTQSGLTTSNQSGAIKEFEKALDAGDKARKALTPLRSQVATDAEYAEAVQRIDARLEEALAECRVHLADTYLMRGSYQQASEVVRAGLAEYPSNVRLQQAMDRVSSASSDRDGGWVIVGGPRGR